MDSFLDFLIISGIILGIAFVIATRFSKNRGNKTIIYLDLIVVFLVLSNFQSFLFERVLTDAPFFIRRMHIPWYVLIPTAFYTFITHYLKIEKKTNSYVMISLFIYWVEIIIRMALFPFYFNQENSFVIGKYKQIEEIVNTAFMTFIFIKSVVIIFKYTDLYKSILDYDNLRWLKNFAFLGGLVILMWVCAIILNISHVINPLIQIYYPLRISTTVLLYWLSYQGFYNYSLMAERIALREELIADDKEKNKSLDNNTLNNHSDDDKFFMVKNHIEQNKRYRDPSFSLERLSSEVNMSISKLSQLINKESGQNFSDFINQLRVENAKKYLKDDNFSNYTIVAIGLECGFNSKSAFYTAFKKFTSLTPSEYKNNNSMMS